jgi:hypothetical protein
LIEFDISETLAFAEIGKSPTLTERHFVMLANLPNGVGAAGQVMRAAPS